MRGRINIVALLRDLSVEQIKPVLTLKHREIARFHQKQGVNLEWLLEGKGRVFKNHAIAPNLAMSGGEFAALVRTLPEAEQRMIEAVCALAGRVRWTTSAELIGSAVPLGTIHDPHCPAFTGGASYCADFAGTSATVCC